MESKELLGFLHSIISQLMPQKIILVLSGLNFITLLSTTFLNFTGWFVVKKQHKICAALY